MSQEIIKVTLSQRDKTDVLIFAIKKNTADAEYYVDLGSSTNSQAQLKRIFSRLLEIIVEKDVTLELQIEEGFNFALQKEVCEEYIKDLNNELSTVKEHINEQMKPDSLDDQETSSSGTDDFNW